MLVAGEGLAALLAWLRGEKGGVHTYYAFSKHAQAVADAEPNNAVICLILQNMALRFAATYQGEPLDVHVALLAHEKLIAFLEQAVAGESADTDTKLEFISALSRSSL